MKKIIVVLIVLGFASSVNAQQFPLLPKQQSLKQFRFSPDSLAKNNFLFKQPDSLLAKPELRFNVMANTNIDNMPVARMQGYTNMPVVQTDKTGYNMPVAGMRQPRVYNMKKPAADAQVVPLSNPAK